MWNDGVFGRSDGTWPDEMHEKKNYRQLNGMPKTSAWSEIDIFVLDFPTDEEYFNENSFSTVHHENAEMHFGLVGGDGGDDAKIQLPFIFQSVLIKLTR